MSSVTIPGRRRATSSGPMTLVGIPIRWWIATFARRFPTSGAGTSSMNPVRTNPHSPAPTSSAQSRKYGNEAQARRDSASRS